MKLKLRGEFIVEDNYCLYLGVEVISELRSAS
jgi:hypothetical protein